MYTLNGTEVHAVCYGICSYDSNAMKSSNPHSGIYVAETARTLDLNGGSPACNQGGTLVLERAVGVDLYNQCLTGEMAKTVRSSRSDNDHVPCVIVERRPE